MFPWHQPHCKFRWKEKMVMLLGMLLVFVQELVLALGASEVPRISRVPEGIAIAKTCAGSDH